MFIESTPTEAQLERVAERKYRAFLMTNMDGSQELITIFDGVHNAQVARRNNRWETWSAPRYFIEIYD